ncbi:MAG: hypothetical protein LBE79_09595 [Tannerella sp.]|jgi:hypothetical protein|nr:hypothetical protein [Tannerella sp.]
MNLPKYPLASSDRMMTFEFIGEGSKGLIHKLVRFSKPSNPSRMKKANQKYVITEKGKRFLTGQNF